MNVLKKKNAVGTCMVTRVQDSARANAFAYWGGVIGCVTTIATKDNLVAEFYEEGKEENNRL